MLAALDRYVKDLKARGVHEDLESSRAGSFDTSPLVSLVTFALLAVLFLGEAIVVSVSPLGSDELILSFGNALSVYYLAVLPVILCLWKLLAWHRARHPDGPLWRLERARGLKLSALALWFWLRGFRWLIALVLALWCGSWLAGRVTAAVAGAFAGAALDDLQDSLARLLTVLLLIFLVWLTKMRITRHLTRPETT